MAFGNFSSAALARNIRNRRTAMGRSQAWLGQKVGISRYTVMRIEAGGHTSTRYLNEIARALGCTVLDLITPPPRARRSRPRSAA